MKRITLILLSMGVLYNVLAQYPSIRIADVMVTPENQDSITSDYIVGTIRYDSASRILILQNATIYRCDDPSDTYDDDNFGKTVSLEAHYGQNLNIELIGQNTIYGIKPLTLYGGSYNIIGSGSLVLNGMGVGVSCGLGVDTFRIKKGASVVIDVPYHPAIGFQGSSQYQEYDQTVMSIDSGALIINADYCIQSIVGFELNGSYVVSPEGAYYDPGEKTLVVGDDPVRDYLEIRPGTVGVPAYENAALTVYPNPTDDLLFVELRGAGIAHVALYDLQGRVVTGVCDTPLQTATATLNVKSLPAGVYVLRVKDADGNEHQQKIVRR